MKKIDFVYWDLKIADIFSVMSFLVTSYLFKYVSGKEIASFEKKVSGYLDCKEAILTSSCTGAIHTVLYCLDIGVGDEVITSPLTFVSTINAIRLVGAKPVVVDVDADTFNINVDLIEKNITKNTKAILVVDLFGNPCDYAKLKVLSKKYKLPLIADSAQAFGSKYKGKMIGSIADVTCFSFENNKSITSLTGGLISTNNRVLASKMRSFINYGFPNTNYFGWNYVPNDLLASLLSSQLSRIDSLVIERNEFANFYKKIMRNTTFQIVREGNLSNYSYFVINHKNVNKTKYLIKKLKSLDIEARIFGASLKGVFSNSEIKHLPIFAKLANTLVCLPINKKLRSRDCILYIEKIISRLSKNSRYF